MIVAIYAYEGQYQGLHGISDTAVVEVDDMNAATELAMQMSEDVMYNYSQIIDEFREEAYEQGYEEDTEESEEYIQECINTNIMYEIYEVVKNLDDFDGYDSLEQEFYQQREIFIDRHCEEG